jgi:Ca2+-binding EF-hand superfamily protein
MKSFDNKLSRSELEEILMKYDENKDNKIYKSELKLVVTDVFKKTNSKTKLSEEDEKTIDEIVFDILDERDKNKDGFLDLEELSTYYEVKTFYKKSIVRN